MLLKVRKDLIEFGTFISFWEDINHFANKWLTNKGEISFGPSRDLMYFNSERFAIQIIKRKFPQARKINNFDDRINNGNITTFAIYKI